jgi:hypothetical protein
VVATVGVISFMARMLFANGKFISSVRRRARVILKALGKNQGLLELDLSSQPKRKGEEAALVVVGIHSGKQPTRKRPVSGGR